MLGVFVLNFHVLPSGGPCTRGTVRRAPVLRGHKQSGYAAPCARSLLLQAASKRPLRLGNRLVSVSQGAPFSWRSQVADDPLSCALIHSSPVSWSCVARMHNINRRKDMR